MTMTWTPEDDRRLLKLRTWGWTFGQIALAFGTTRNAIAGRIYRLKRSSGYG